jgi:hypothetical protein
MAGSFGRKSEFANDRPIFVGDGSFTGRTVTAFSGYSCRHQARSQIFVCGKMVARGKIPVGNGFGGTQLT